MRVKLSRADRLAGAAGSQPTGIRTADPCAGGQLHYHWTIACSGSHLFPRY